MSGTTGGPTVTITANTAQLDAALGAAAASAAAAFQRMAQSGDSASSRISAALDALDQALRKLSSGQQAAATAAESASAATVTASKRAVSAMETQVQSYRFLGESLSGLRDDLRAGVISQQQFTAAQAEAAQVYSDLNRVSLEQRTAMEQRAQYATAEGFALRSLIDRNVSLGQALTSVTAAYGETRTAAQARADAEAAFGRSIEASTEAVQADISVMGEQAARYRFLGESLAQLRAELRAGTLSQQQFTESQRQTAQVYSDLSRESLVQRTAIRERIQYASAENVATRDLIMRHVALGQALNSETRAYGELRTAAQAAADLQAAFGARVEASAQTMERMGEATRRTHASARLLTEVIVTINEIMTGRFSRIPGTINVIAENLRAAGQGAMMMVAGIGVAAFAVNDLVEAYNRWKGAVSQVAAVSATHNMDDLASEWDHVREIVHTVAGSTQEEAAKIVTSMQMTSGVTAQTAQFMAYAMKPVAAAMGEDLHQMTTLFESAFSGQEDAARKFFHSIGADVDQLPAHFSSMTAAQQSAVQTMMAAWAELNQAEDGTRTTIDRLRMTRQALLAAVEAVRQKVIEEGEATRHSTTDLGFWASALVNAHNVVVGLAGAVVGLTGSMTLYNAVIRQTGDLESVAAINANRRVAAEGAAGQAMDDLNTKNRETRETVSQATQAVRAHIEALRADAAVAMTSSSAGVTPAAERALAVKSADIAVSEIRREMDAASDMTETRRALGVMLSQALIEQAHAVAAQTVAAESTWLQRAEDAARTAAAAASAGARDSTTAHRQAAEATLAAWTRTYDDLLARQKTSSDVTEKMVTEAHERMMAARESLNLREAAGSAKSARDELSVQIGAITEKQRLVQHDFSQWMALEDQKLAVARGHAVEYQRIEVERAEFVARNNDRMAQEQVRGIETANRVDMRGLEAHRQTLEGEVAGYQLSRVQMDQIDRQRTIEAYTQDLERLQHFLETTDRMLPAWSEVSRQMEQVRADLGEQVAAIDRRMVQDTKIAAQESARAWEQMFDSVGSTAEREFGALVTYTTTWQKAEASVLRGLLTDFSGIVAKMAQQWVVMEVARATVDQATQQRIAVQQAAGQSGFMTLVRSATGLFTASEVTKAAVASASQGSQTASTVAGNAARTASNSVAQTSENSWFLVRLARWVASELGMTASTTSQDTTRVISQTASDAAASTAATTANVQQALSYAAVGGSAAGASAAAIPLVGWAMAPGVSAGVYADLSSYAGLAALATGTMDVPQDMVAQIHRGEMVVPQTFASGLRSMLSGGFSQTTTDNSRNSGHTFHYSPTISAGGADVHRAVASGHEDFRTYINNMTRNGNLRLPGR